MNPVLKHQPLLETLAEVLNYSDLLALSRFEIRFKPYLQARNLKLSIVRKWLKMRKKITLTNLANLETLKINDERITTIPPALFFKLLP